MLKIKNVVKSNEKVQLYDIANTSVNTGTYVKIGVPTHAQYNSEVSQTKAQYIFDTKKNINIIQADSENVDFTSFVTIGEEAIICGCITMHDIIDFYANNCIQQFYEDFCSSHSDSESIVLARFLSAIGVEVWKDVTCYGAIYKGLYMVSNLGRVKRLFKNHVGKILKPYDCGKQGYLYVALFHKCKRQNVRVNRLVGLTFYGESNEPLEACHSNTNSYDNRLFNLEFKTHYENIMNPITQKKRNDTLKAKADKADKASTASTTAPTASTLE